MELDCSVTRYNEVTNPEQNVKGDFELSVSKTLALEPVPTELGSGAWSALSSTCCAARANNSIAGLHKQQRTSK